jgi:hypothetical protein
MTYIKADASDHCSSLGTMADINEITLRAGYRARMVAPLLRGEDIVGTLVVRRRTPGEFAKNTSTSSRPLQRNRHSPFRTRGCSTRSRTRADS